MASCLLKEQIIMDEKRKYVENKTNMLFWQTEIKSVEMKYIKN